MTTFRCMSSRNAPAWLAARPKIISRQQWLQARRSVQISTRPASQLTDLEELSLDDTRDVSAGVADAGFEVLSAPFSLLKVSLSASQPLYTRRGTLVALNGKVDNVISTLSFLEPVTRAVLGIPFFYQKITSATPITALISSKSNYTSFATIHLDGTLDWMVAQRNALLCWTGQTISLSPRMRTSLSLAHWGSTQVTGRGLLGVVGKGQIFEVDVGPGEQYTVHPSNVVAYSMNRLAPVPYRFKSSVFRLQVPGLDLFLSWFGDVKFFQSMQQTATWKIFARILYTIRTWSRRTIWGDRLFLQFQGPTTILLQARGSQIRDVLTTREINEIADSEPGVIPAARALTKPDSASEAPPTVTKSTPTATKISYVQVEQDGEVKFDPPKP